MHVYNAYKHIVQTLVLAIQGYYLADSIWVQSTIATRYSMSDILDNMVYMGTVNSNNT